MRRPATLKDVSQAAGLSLITVSRALRRPESVKAETRDRIQKTIDQLGYVPNLTARSLVSRRSNTVGAIVPILRSSLFSSAVQSLAKVLQASGIQLLVGASERSSSIESELMNAFVGRQADALVLTGFTHAAPTRERLRRYRGPVVETFNLRPDPIDLVVGYDNVEAARTLTSQLLARGYRRIALVGGDFTNNDQAFDRQRGFFMAMKDAGVAVPPEFVISVPQPTTMESGRDAIRRLIARSPRPDLVCFHSEIPAVGGLLECLRLGLSIPGDIALAGYGDLEISPNLPVPLTTVHVRSDAIGRITGELIVRRLRGEKIDEPVVDVGFETVMRASA
ncbi:MAG: LacI family DNA-binding transcriptional regulator [Alsobacter sp.]